MCEHIVDTVLCITVYLPPALTLCFVMVMFMSNVLITYYDYTHTQALVHYYSLQTASEDGQWQTNQSGAE
jgi:hypothetical protein